MSRELNINASGSTCPPCRSDADFEGEHYHNSFIQPRYLFYGKDVIKQTMLKQEEILIFQVAELHRLYKIQAIKMDELRSRKLLDEDYSKVDNSIQNPFLSELPSENNPQETPSIQIMPFSSSAVTLDYKGNKQMFDLSLPASEYMDFEEIELYEQEIVCNAREFPEEKDSDVVLPLSHCGEVEQFCTSDVLTAPESSSSRLATLFDLNEPYQPNEVDIPGACLQGIFDNPPTRRDLDDYSENQAKEDQEKLPTGNYDSGAPTGNTNLFGSKILTMSLESSHHDANKALELPGDEKPPRSLEASDRKHRLLKEKSMKKNKPPKLPKTLEIVPYQPNPESSVVTMRNYVNNVERRPIVIQALPCFSKGSLHKKRKCKASWDLIATGFLEGPISPENEESSRPRGDSTEKEIETVANGHLSKKAKQAAEALVSISSTKVQACEKNGNHDSSPHCDADYLFLFAGIASSSLKDGINRDQELDYFEIMTLETPETEADESSFIKKDYKEENTEESLTQKSLKKGRGSIGKQLKNFQTELLPSIVSLSRQEMKEDFQLIENLRAVTAVSKKGKSTARSRRKNPKTTEVNLVDELKLLERMHEMGCLEERLPGWSKVHRRPRFAATTSPSPIIVTQNIDESNEWLVGRLDGEEDDDEERVWQDYDLTWEAVSTARGGEDALLRRTRASSSNGAMTAPSSSSSTRVEILDDEDEDDLFVDNEGYLSHNDEDDDDIDVDMLDD